MWHSISGNVHFDCTLSFTFFLQCSYTCSKMVKPPIPYENISCSFFTDSSDVKTSVLWAHAGSSKRVFGTELSCYRRSSHTTAATVTISMQCQLVAEDSSTACSWTTVLCCLLSGSTPLCFLVVRQTLQPSSEGRKIKHMLSMIIII